VRFPEVLDAGETTSLVPFWDLETWKFSVFYVLLWVLPAWSFLILEIRRQKGRQIKCAHAHIVCLPFSCSI
jgi:hypothetical protein